LPTLVATHHAVTQLEQLGDEIAELAANLDAATARLLELLRQFDARGGWNNGFQSCAHWLSWRIGLDLGAARERVRVAHALATLPRLAEAPARGSFRRPCAARFTTETALAASRAAEQGSGKDITCSTGPTAARQS
jgi:hypothetical protein